MTSAGRRSPSVARTLDNGIAVLDAVSRVPAGATVSELARAVGLDRTVVHRLVATLVARQLMRRRPDGRFTLGTGLLELAAAVLTDLRGAAGEVLPQLARAVGATTHLSVREGDEVVSVAVVEPPGTALHVGYRIGSRHRVDRGAAGLAIAMAGPPQPGERPEIGAARRIGFIVTQSELEPGAWGLAAPVRVSSAGPDDVSVAQATEVTASIGVIALRPLDPAVVGPLVVAAAHTIAERNGSTS